MMNPLFARILLTALCSVIALIGAHISGFAPTLETMAGAFFAGGFAGALISARLPRVVGTPG
jgi:hypothetical protein